MKFSVAAILVVLVVASICQAAPSNVEKRGRVWDYIQKTGKAAGDRLKDVAVKVKNFTQRVFGEAFREAKKVFVRVVRSATFELVVNQLIPMLEAEETEDNCKQVCADRADDIQFIGQALADSACPPMCDGAIAKLAEAAQRLSENLKDDGGDEVTGK